jgi:hypothetical protein
LLYLFVHVGEMDCAKVSLRSIDESWMEDIVAFSSF